MADNTLTLKIEVLDDGSAVIKDFQGNIHDLSGSAETESSAAQGAFESLKAKIEEFGSATSTQLGIGGALGAIVAFTAKSVTSLAEFENAMTDVQKTTGMAAPEIARLGDALRQMATVDLQGLVSADALADIAAQAGQLGIQGAPNIQAFTKAIGEMVVATDLSAEQAATDLAEIENVFRTSLQAAGKSAESQTANIGSAFNTLSNTTSATVEQIMDMTRRMGGAASTLGMSVAEVAGIAATLKSAGVDVEVGGTAMSKFFLQLMTDSSSFAQTLKLDATAVATALKTEPVAAVQMVLEGMAKLKDAEGPAALAAALDELGIKDTRLVDAMLKLSGATTQLDTNVKASVASFQQGSSMHEEFVTKAESSISKWQGIGEKSKEVFRDFGQELKPATALLTEWTTGALDVVNAAATAWQGGVRDNFFDALVARAQQGVGIEGMLSTAGTAISGFVGQAATDIGTLIGDFQTGSATIGEAFDGLWIGVKDAAKSALAALGSQAKDTMSSLGASLTQPFEDAAAAIESAFVGLGAKIGKEFDAAKQKAKDFFNVFQSETITGVFQKLTDEIIGVTEAEDTLNESVVDSIDAVSELGRVAYGFTTYPDMTAAIVETTDAQEVLTESVEVTTEQVAELGATALESFTAFSDAMSGIGDNLSGLGGNLGGLGDLLGISELGGIGDLLGDISQYAEIPSILGDIGGQIGGIFEGLGGLGDGLSGIFGGVTDALGGLLGGGGLGGLGDALGGLLGGGGFGGLTSAIGGLLPGLGSIGGALGSLGSMAAGLLPALGPIGLAGGAIMLAWDPLKDLFGSVFGDAKSKGNEAAAAMRDFVAANVEGGAEMSAAMSTAYADMKAAGFDYGVFLQQTGTTMDQTFGGISQNWQEGSTAMDIFTQAVGRATGDMQKAPQVALQMVASFQDMGLSAEQAGAKMLEIAEASGMSQAEVESLRASLQGVSGALSGTGEEGGETGQIFDQAASKANDLKGTTDDLSGSLQDVTGQLTGSAAAGAEGANVFSAADAAAKGLDSTVGGLGSSVDGLTSQMTNTSVSAINTSNMFSVAGGSAVMLQGDIDGMTQQAAAGDEQLQNIQASLAAIPKEKVITIRVVQEGNIPSAATGGIISGLAIVNERGPEIARFPGGGMAFMTAPGPVMGAFPAGTEIIPHSRSMDMLRQNPSIPRMAEGGTITGLPGGISVTINNLVVQGQMGNSADMRRLADQLSTQIAARVLEKTRVRR